MKESKLPFKTRRRILNVITAIFTAAMIFFYKFLTKTELGVTILVVFLIAYSVLAYFWWRCCSAAFSSSLCRRS